jgi:predicted tellurium resistance membrane protein TerC
MNELIQSIVDNPIPSLVIVGNLIIIESLLSVDNAAVLATMVIDLPKEQRGRALKYGIWGAYFFRGLAMLFASVLIKIWWLKPLGGLYLLYLVFDWWKGKQTETKEDNFVDKNSFLSPILCERQMSAACLPKDIERISFFVRGLLFFIFFMIYFAFHPL